MPPNSCLSLSLPATAAAAQIYNTGLILEPIVIIFFAGGCLLTGLRLQMHVLNVRLEAKVQFRLLLQLNIVLAVVFLCYLARAVFILIISFSNTNSSGTSYFVWILCTHW